MKSTTNRYWRIGMRRVPMVGIAAALALTLAATPAAAAWTDVLSLNLGTIQAGDFNLEDRSGAGLLPEPRVYRVVPDGSLGTEFAQGVFGAELGITPPQPGDTIASVWDLDLKMVGDNLVARLDIAQDGALCPGINGEEGYTTFPYEYLAFVDLTGMGNWATATQLRPVGVGLGDEDPELQQARAAELAALGGTLVDDGGAFQPFEPSHGGWSAQITGALGYFAASEGDSGEGVYYVGSAGLVRVRIVEIMTIPEWAGAGEAASFGGNPRLSLSQVRSLPGANFTMAAGDDSMKRVLDIAERCLVTSHPLALRPGINLTKLVEDLNGKPVAGSITSPAEVEEGPLQVRYLIVNNHEEALTDIRLTDALLPGLDRSGVNVKWAEPDGMIGDITCFYSDAKGEMLQPQPALLNYTITDGVLTFDGATLVPLPGEPHAIACTTELSGLEPGRPHASEAVVTATGAVSGLAVEDADIASFFVIVPGAGIMVSKKGNGTFASVVNPVRVSPETATSITFIIRNPGNAQLTNIELFDELAGGDTSGVEVDLSSLHCDADYAIAGGRWPVRVATLEPGGIITCTATLPGMVAGDLHVNEATVTAAFAAGTVTDSDSWHARITAVPDVTLTKVGAGSDANTLSAAVSIYDQSVTPITFTIANTGDLPLRNIVLDDALYAGDTSGQITDVSTLRCQDGNLTPVGFTTANGAWPVTLDGELAKQQAITCVADLPPLVDEEIHANVATVTADSDEGPVSDEDPWFARVTATPVNAISVTKRSDSWARSTFEQRAFLALNTEAELTFTITNLGNTALRDLALIDALDEGRFGEVDLGGTLGCVDDLGASVPFTLSGRTATFQFTATNPLAPGAKVICTAVAPPLSAHGQIHANTVVVTATGHPDAAGGAATSAQDRWYAQVPIPAPVFPPAGCLNPNSPAYQDPRYPGWSFQDWKDYMIDKLGLTPVDPNHERPGMGVGFPKGFPDDFPIVFDVDSETWQVNIRSNAGFLDSDGDGWSDADEAALGTNPCHPDSKPERCPYNASLFTTDPDCWRPCPLPGKSHIPFEDEACQEELPTEPYPCPFPGLAQFDILDEQCFPPPPPLCPHIPDSQRCWIWHRQVPEGERIDANRGDLTRGDWDSDCDGYTDTDELSGVLNRNGRDLNGDGIVNEGTFDRQAWHRAGVNNRDPLTGAPAPLTGPGYYPQIRELYTGGERFTPTDPCDREDHPKTTPCAFDPIFFPAELRVKDATCVELCQQNAPGDQACISECPGVQLREFAGRPVYAFDWDKFNSAEWGGWIRYQELTSVNPNEFDWDGDGYSDGFDPEPCNFNRNQSFLPCTAGLNPIYDQLYLEAFGGNPDLYDPRYVDWDGDGWSDAYELGLVDALGNWLVWTQRAIDPDSPSDKPLIHEQTNTYFLKVSTAATMQARYAADNANPVAPVALSSPCNQPQAPTQPLCMGHLETVWTLHVTYNRVVTDPFTGLNYYIDPAFVRDWFTPAEQTRFQGILWMPGMTQQFQVKENTPGAVRAAFICDGGTELPDLAVPPACGPASMLASGNTGYRTGTPGNTATTAVTAGTPAQKRANSIYYYRYAASTTVDPEMDSRIGVTVFLPMSSVFKEGDRRAELLLTVPSAFITAQTLAPQSAWVRAIEVKLASNPDNPIKPENNVVITPVTGIPGDYTWRIAFDVVEGTAFAPGRQFTLDVDFGFYDATLTQQGGSQSLGAANVVAQLFVQNLNPADNWDAQGMATTPMISRANSLACTSWVGYGFTSGQQGFVMDGSTLVWKPTPPCWFNNTCPKATGAAAGSPGTWIPANASAPANRAAMAELAAHNSSGQLSLAAWMVGQYVRLADGTLAFWNGSMWALRPNATAGTAGVFNGTTATPGAGGTFATTPNPTSAAAMVGNWTAVPTTAWSQGQYVVAGTDWVYWNGTTWAARQVATQGANATTTGTFTPAGAPANLAAMVSVRPATTAAWTSFVTLGDGTRAFWNGTAWAQRVPTGAVAGNPGTFYPPGTTVPANLTAMAGMNSVTSAGAATAAGVAWTVGQHVRLGDGTWAYWAGNAFALRSHARAGVCAEAACTAPTPGTFSGATPANLAALADYYPVDQDGVPSRTTAWKHGQYVLLGDGNWAFWTGTAWAHRQTAIAGAPGTFNPVGAPLAQVAMVNVRPSPMTAWNPVNQYVVLRDNNQTYWTGTAWAQPKAATAVAGTPGSFTPIGTTTPADLTALAFVTASPGTAWAAQERVVLGDGSWAYWDGGKWAIRPTATAGSPATFSPAQDPWSIADLAGVRPAPTSVWSTLHFVVLGDGTRAFWNGTTWALRPVANAGSPGTFSDTQPAGLTDMPFVLANPLSTWATGQYVMLGDGNWAHWTGGSWALRPTANAGAPGIWIGAAPASLATMANARPLPDTAWGANEYVVLGNGTWAYWTGATWALRPAAVAGSPGSFSPAGSVAANLAAMVAVRPAPVTPWDAAHYVVLGDGSEATWNGSAWVQRVVGISGTAMFFGPALDFGAFDGLDGSDGLDGYDGLGDAGDLGAFDPLGGSDGVDSSVGSGEFGELAGLDPDAEGGGLVLPEGPRPLGVAIDSGYLEVAWSPVAQARAYRIQVQADDGDWVDALIDDLTVTSGWFVWDGETWVYAQPEELDGVEVAGHQDPQYPADPWAEAELPFWYGFELPPGAKTVQARVQWLIDDGAGHAVAASAWSTSPLLDATTGRPITPGTHVTNFVGTDFHSMMFGIPFGVLLPVAVRKALLVSEPDPDGDELG